MNGSQIAYTLGNCGASIEEEMNENCVAFDLDGTLISSQLACNLTSQAILAPVLKRDVSLEEIEEKFLLPINKFYENFGINDRQIIKDLGLSWWKRAPDFTDEIIPSSLE